MFLICYNLVLTSFYLQTQVCKYPKEQHVIQFNLELVQSPTKQKEIPLCPRRKYSFVPFSRVTSSSLGPLFIRLFSFFKVRKSFMQSFALLQIFLDLLDSLPHGDMSRTGQRHERKEMCEYLRNLTFTERTRTKVSQF